MSALKGAHDDRLARSRVARGGAMIPARAQSDQFPGVGKMNGVDAHHAKTLCSRREINHMQCRFMNFHIDRVQFGAYASLHIRPLAVSPLTHPESVPNPWGFSFSGSPCRVSPQEGRQ